MSFILSLPPPYGRTGGESGFAANIDNFIYSFFQHLSFLLDGARGLRSTHQFFFSMVQKGKKGTNKNDFF